MPRKSRIDAPGAFHHVIIRGIERTAIFRDNRDRDSFLDRLGGILLETSTPCYAWALMGNHAHFLFRTGQVPIAQVMRKFLTGYAVTFNRRHRRHGHLFQNRYKSILCEEDAYLLELVRYIHLNPVRSGIVKDLRELASYPYSGHEVLMGRKGRSWQDRDYVLKSFGQTEREARSRYSSFISKGVEEGRKPELVGGGLLRSAGGWKGLKDMRDAGEKVSGDERILGRSEFVERVLKESEEEWERKSLLRRRGPGIRRLMEKVSEHCHVDIEELRSGNRVRTVARARAVLCFLTVRKFGLESAFVAKELGMTPSAVSKAIVRAQGLSECAAIEKNLFVRE